MIGHLGRAVILTALYVFDNDKRPNVPTVPFDAFIPHGLQRSALNQKCYCTDAVD